MDNHSKRPTLHDVAQLAGVSSQTVSRVINKQKRVSDETRARVLDAVAELGYRPNRAAQMLNTQRSKTLEVLTVDPETSLFRSTLSHIAYTVREHGYNISFSLFKRGELGDALDDAASRLVDGLILIPSLFLPDLEIDALPNLNHPIPVVQITPVLALDSPSVAYNQAAGVRAVTKHLIELGHTQFAELLGRPDMIETQIRHNAWLQVAEEFQLDPGPNAHGNFFVQGGYDATKTLLNKNAGFTALICGNDRMALGALHALSEKGIRVPEDVSVVGFDNVEGSDHFNPPLTTVAMDFSQLGRLAAEYVVELIEKPNTPVYQKVLTPQLIIRKSTAGRR